MNDYFSAIMDEQIHRGNALKKRIPHPLPFSELEALAERCETIIDEQITNLSELQDFLIDATESDRRFILRQFRECCRNIEMVEAYGVSALYYQSEELGYFNKLIKDIQIEISLPIRCPSVACISTSYYYFHPFTDVVFVPLAESDFLLHLPDLFHELGHAILNEKEKSPHLEKLDETYREIIGLITEYYNQLKIDTMRETGPEAIPLQIEILHSHWKENWIEEFLSDLFALYTLGPAYANAHLHLVIKKSESIYDIPTLFPQSHPSDDSRLTLMHIGLNNIGYSDEISVLKARWDNMPIHQRALRPPDYHFAYPQHLLKQIADIFLEGLKQCGIAIATKERMEELKDRSIILLLDNAWNTFWEDTKAFREWERNKIVELKLRYTPS